MHLTIWRDEPGASLASTNLSESGDCPLPLPGRARDECFIASPGRPQGNIYHRRWCPVLAVFLGMFLILCFSCKPATTVAASSGLTLQINAGLGTYFRSGTWVPLYVSLDNTGPDFSGMLTTSNPAGIIWQDTYSMVPTSAYQQAVMVPRRTRKQVTLFLPITAQSNGVNISVQLLDSRGKMVQSQSVLLRQLFSGNVFVGLLSENLAGFDALKNVALPDSNNSVQVQYLNAQTMPSMEAVLANFDMIILDTFDSSTLSHEQLRALYLWVQRGGTLIEVGGQHWQQTLRTLPAGLLPIDVHGVSDLPIGTHILSVDTSSSTHSGITNADTLRVPIPVSSATVLAGARTILAAGDIPLLVQLQSRQGFIYYLAYDPTLASIIHWTGATALWRSLIFRSLGAQLLPNNFSQDLSAGIPFYLAKLQHLLLYNPSPTPWLLLLLFLCYLIMLGPIRWLIMRRTKRRQWGWRIILGTIVIFSVFHYAAALSQERASIYSNSFSIIQLSRGSTFAHSTTYHGVYVPFMSAGSSIQVQFPNGSLVQPFVDSDQQSEQAAITAISDGTQVKVSASMIRTLDAFQAERDIAIQRGIISHLILRQGILTGTVTNMLPTKLSDVYLLMPHSLIRIGSLSAGQTSNVTLPLTMPVTNGGEMACGSLVKQVVNNDAGILTEYDHLSFRKVLQSLSARQRHLSLLAFMLTASQCSNSPFEVAESSATLIGWADQPLAGENAVTVNGVLAGGIHETAVVAALDINYAAGPAVLPGDVIPGRLVDADALGARLLSTNSYAFSHGQLTFEYSLPSLAHFHIQTMTLHEPMDPSVLPDKQPGGLHSSASHIALYNWQSHSWDIIHLTQSTPFTTQNARVYFSLDGRMLVQYVNKASDFSDIAFTMPSITISGIVAPS